MPKAKPLVVEGVTWTKRFGDDRSAHWFETVGPFGELVVEQGYGSDTFKAYWWPPQVRAGEPVLLQEHFPDRDTAMRHAVGYIQRLAMLLSSKASP